MWSSPPANEAVPPGTNRTIYVLSGSSACNPTENGGHWCGYGNGKPQTLLFSSTDLTNWKFVNVFWKGGSTSNPAGQLPGGGSMYVSPSHAHPPSAPTLSVQKYDNWQ